MSKKKLYFANDLFNEATRDYNEKVVQAIEKQFGDALTIYLPQRNLGINDKNAYADAQMIADGDYKELNESDILLAVLDSQDFGVGLEIGIAYEQKKPIVGVYTDVRQQGADNAKKIEALKEIGQNQFSYLNLMGSGLVLNNGYLVNNTEDILSSIAKVLYAIDNPAS